MPCVRHLLGAVSSGLGAWGPGSRERERWVRVLWGESIEVKGAASALKNLGTTFAYRDPTPS